MKSLKITLAALAFAMLSGCNQDVEGPLYTKQGGFAFAAAVLNVETGTEDDGKISVPVYRSGNTDNIAQIEFEIQVEKTEGDSLVLQWVSTDPDGIFSLTTPRVVFADGATVAAQA